MSPQTLRLAAANWRAVHEAVHGPLAPQTAETVNEALSFVITCAQVDDDLPEPGTPLHSELIRDAQDAITREER